MPMFLCETCGLCWSDDLGTERCPVCDIKANVDDMERMQSSTGAKRTNPEPVPPAFVPYVARIRDGWEHAGREVLVVGPDVVVGQQWWTPIVDEAEDEDPTFHKTAGLVAREG